MTPHQMLCAIEIDAECAIAQQLAVIIQEVQALRPTLEVDDRDFADCLLLKLDQLIRNQQLMPLDGNSQLVVAAAKLETPCPVIGSPAPEEVAEEILSAA